MPRGFEENEVSRTSLYKENTHFGQLGYTHRAQVCVRTALSLSLIPRCEFYNPISTDVCTCASAFEVEFSRSLDQEYLGNAGTLEIGFTSLSLPLSLSQDQLLRSQTYRQLCSASLSVRLCTSITRILGLRIQSNRA